MCVLCMALSGPYKIPRENISQLAGQRSGCGSTNPFDHKGKTVGTVLGQPDKTAWRIAHCDMQASVGTVELTLLPCRGEPKVMRVS